jgi:peptidoglycan/LPS O-acetylase OafA/YrhL
MFIYMLCGCAAALYWKRLRFFLKKVPLIIWLIATLITFALAATLPSASIFNQIKQTVVMPLLICFVVLGTPTADWRVKAIFENRAISYFGKMSYTVYLWQQLATADYLAAPPWLSFILLCAVFLFAYYSYEYLERPLMRLGANWSERIKGRAVSAAPLAI